MTADADLLGMLIATLGGTAVGLERQRSGHAVAGGTLAVMILAAAAAFALLLP